MNAIQVLKLEHIDIERELFELDAIMEGEVINYPNLLHVFRRLCELWDPHEEREELVFGVMKKERIKVPVYKMTCEHRDLRGHIKRMKEAINLGSDYRIRKAFHDDLRIIVGKIRRHMLMEDEVLYTLALEVFTDEELAEMSRAVEES